MPRVDIQKEKVGHEPLVSVIIAAKDEGDHIQKTIYSLLKQHYSNLEIILVNDRSVDHTQEMINGFTGDPRIKAIHVCSLPIGWMGKNHALYQG
ncbi:glycosyltransferase family 2 protein [Ammoniphilus sp. YIM 78166]|uniref:glycosyltransferase n=1 Tax=Ammoniphilus sp. YIM 78166 TaxID=1644106 RepID=UPI0014318C9B|nr:glycosyltransferase [Ammoniphilus sp. YIM 78166]